MATATADGRSFRLDRRSPLASRLRAAISHKLPDFLGDYSDDVLAEYITVLVCNGKDQNQARNDLEEFLGDESETFVTWLWDYLCKEFCLPKVPPGSPSNIADMTSGHGDDDINTNLWPEPTFSAEVLDDRYEPTVSPNSKILNPIGLSEGFKHLSESSPLPEVNAKKLLLQPHGVHEQNASNDGNCRGDPDYLSSKMNHSLGNVACGDQGMSYDNQYQKIAKSNSGESPSQADCIPKRDPVSRNPQLFTTGDTRYMPLSRTNPDGKRLPLAAGDYGQNHTNRPRGNVWDRLSMPCTEDNNTLLTGKKSQHASDVVKRKRLKHSELQKPGLMRVVSGANLSQSSMGESAALASNSGKAITNSQSKGMRMLDDNLQSGSLDDGYKSKRKRHFVDVNFRNNDASFPAFKESRSQGKDESQKLLNASSINNHGVQNLNEVKLNKKSTTLSSGIDYNSVKSPSINPNSQANGASHASLKKAQVTPAEKLLPTRNSMSAEFKSPGTSKDKNATHRPKQNEVLDVKLRLQNIEKEMLKLRSKQAEISNDTKLTAPSGAQSHPEEDIDSRTVLVTNVHYAATKETLSAHFTKCGGVVKVVMLTDTITAQPKGAAYIVFASKDSVDKAVVLSGTSFFSRILTVMRKADMPPGFLVPAQTAGKPVQPWCHPQHHKKGSQQRHHLQWRRDQPAGGESSSSTATRTLNASNAEG